MNEYIFYTTEGNTTPPREDKKVENCQVLGFANGNNAKDALNNLLQENQWITECGYNTAKILNRQIAK